MKSVEEAVERLSVLSRDDRAWILSALSGSAQARLRELAAMHGISGPSGTSLFPAPLASVADAGPVSKGSAERALQALEDQVPERIAACLDAEPAWVLAALLAMRAWRWEEPLLAKLPPDRRLEVARLRVTLPPLSQKLADTLARVLAGRLSSPGATANVAGFEQVLRGLRSRPRRRTWRLGVSP